MKKLTFGEVQVQIEEAICNYCREKKTCFRTALPASFFYQEVEYDYRYIGVDPDLKVPFLGKSYFRCEDREFEPVVKKISYINKEKNTHICKDCAKQISNYK